MGEGADSVSEKHTQPQDRDSGLVERTWVRTSRRRGQLTERTLEGEHVQATWIDKSGKLQRAMGKVTRNAAGELAVESWSDGVRKESSVPREANVDRSQR